MVSTWDLSTKYGISTKAVHRILEESGVQCQLIRCCAEWPEVEAIQALDSLDKRRLKRLQKNQQNADSLPAGYVWPGEVVELFPELDFAYVIRSLAQSEVCRLKVNKKFAYRRDHAIEHLERVRRRKIMQQQIDEQTRMNRESRIRKPPRQEEFREKPLLQLPPLEDFRRVAEEFRRTNPWR